MSNTQLVETLQAEGIMVRSEVTNPSSWSPQFPPTQRLAVKGILQEVLELAMLGAVPVDPFGLTLKEFLSMSLQETGKLHEKAAILSKPILDDAWKRGVKQVIICDGKIIHETFGAGILSQIVKKESERRNKPCYAFSAPPIIEEYVSSWTYVRRDDYYPTLIINLSPPDSDSVENNYVSFNADFDTGNQETKAFDVNRIGRLLGEFSPYEREVGTHPAGFYSFFRKQAKVWVKDKAGRLNDGKVLH